MYSCYDPWIHRFSMFLLVILIKSGVPIFKVSISRLKLGRSRSYCYLVISQTPLRKPSNRVSNLYFSEVPEFNFQSFKEFLASLNRATQISTLSLYHQKWTEKYSQGLHRRFSSHPAVSGIMPALWGPWGAGNHFSKGIGPSPSWIYNQNAPVE